MDRITKEMLAKMPAEARAHIEQVINAVDEMLDMPELNNPEMVELALTIPLGPYMINCVLGKTTQENTRVLILNNKTLCNEVARLRAEVAILKMK